jgi:hypothetical protein
VKSFFDLAEAKKQKITPKIAHRKYGYPEIVQPKTDPNSANFLELFLIFGAMLRLRKQRGK